MITRSKSYKTRLGEEVEIKTIAGTPGYCITGLIFHKETSVTLACWNKNGRFLSDCTQHKWDLLEVTE